MMNRFLALGCNCRVGMHIRHMTESTNTVFNLAASHTFAGVIHCIQNQFRRLVDMDHVSYTPIGTEGHSHWHNSAYNVTFLHDDFNSYDEVRARYERRIRRWNEAIAAGPVHFVREYGSRDDGYRLLELFPECRLILVNYGPELDVVYEDEKITEWHVAAEHGWPPEMWQFDTEVWRRILTRQTAV